MKRTLPIIALLLAACAAHPSRPQPREPTLAEWQAADFGSKPVYYNAAIRDYLTNKGKDLNDTTIRFKKEPEATWIGDVPNFQYGYGICVEVSERKVDIEHINFGPTFFFLVNGTVTEMREGTKAASLCGRLGQIPDGRVIDRSGADRGVR